MHYALTKVINGKRNTVHFTTTQNPNTMLVRAICRTYNSLAIQQVIPKKEARAIWRRLKSKHFIQTN